VGRGPTLSPTCLRPGEGSLLPLWTFKCPRGRKHVTSLAWSPAYGDMFAVRAGAGRVGTELEQPCHPLGGLLV
jgi:hypothetical protein